MSRDVVVTGIGVMSALGIGQQELGEALLAGRAGLRAQPALGGQLVGEAPPLLRGRATRHLDRSAAMFMSAANEAWRDGGLDEPEDPARVAVIEGSSLGPSSELLAALRRRVESHDTSPPRPTGLVRFMTGAGGAAFAHARGILGAVLHVSAGSVSASAAIGEAYLKIACGLVDIAVAGGAECPLQSDILANFAAAGVLGASCRPFDVSRGGTVLGEGAGVVVLESAEHAARRGARLRARVAGYGLATEAFSMIAPDPQGAGIVAAVTQALRATRNSRIDWIKSHGTGTRTNDAAECRGLARALGSEFAAIPLTSLKPALGHSLGASGGVETVAAVVALERGFIPATLGTTDIDPELAACDVVLEVRVSRATQVLILAESFGGRCAALLLEAA